MLGILKVTQDNPHATNGQKSPCKTSRYKAILTGLNPLSQSISSFTKNMASTKMEIDFIEDKVQVMD